MSVSLAVIGDCHVSELMYVHRPRIRGDAYRALSSVVDQILGMPGMVAAVFAGDCFDSRWPSPRDFKTMAAQIGRLHKAGMRVLAIQGNHDLWKDDPWMSLCGAEPLSGRTVDVGPLSISGMDYCVGKKFAELSDWMSRLHGTDVLVLHQSLSFLNSFDPCSVDPEDIPDGVAMGAVCGHIHIPEIRRSMSGRFAVSSGSTHPRTLAEPPGSFVVIEDGVPRIVPVPGTRRIFRFLVDEQDKGEEALTFLEKLPVDLSDDDKPLVEIRHTPEQSEVADRARTFEERCHLFVSAVGNITLEEASFRPDGVEVAPPSEVLSRFVPAGSKEHLLIHQLVEAGDPEKVLVALDEEFNERIRSIEPASA